MPTIRSGHAGRLSRAREDFVTQVVQDRTQDAVFPNSGPGKAVFGHIPGFTLIAVTKRRFPVGASAG